MAIVRLIMRVPSNVQTGPDSWQDTTGYQTFDLPCPAHLFGKFTGSMPPVIVGAEIRDAPADPPEGEEEEGACQDCAHPNNEHDEIGRCADCGGNERHSFAAPVPDEEEGEEG